MPTQPAPAPTPRPYTAPVSEHAYRCGLQPSEAHVPDYMAGQFLVCAFARGADYCAELDMMERTMHALGGVAPVLEERDDRDRPRRWVEACGAKACFVYRMVCDRVYERPGAEWLLYLDADARWNRLPTREELNAVPPGGVGIHRLGGVELISATMLFRAPFSDAAWLANDWMDAQRARPHEWDQRVLDRVISDPAPEHPRPPVIDLGPEWCWIDAAWPERSHDLSWGRYGDDAPEPIIVQTQASRRLKKDRG